MLDLSIENLRDYLATAIDKIWESKIIPVLQESNSNDKNVNTEDTGHILKQKLATIIHKDYAILNEKERI